MKNKNWFWGLFFVLAAVFVVGSQFSSQFGFWSLLCTVFFAAIFIHSLIKLNYFGIFAPLAFLYSIYSKTLGLPDLSIWILLLSALLASIGCHMLFHRHCHWKCFKHKSIEDFSQNIANSDDNHPYAKVSFGSSSQYLHGDCLESGEFVSSFGTLDVYFDQALISPSGANISLDCSFGTIRLYIPRLWQVKDSIHTSFGSVDNTRLAQPAPDAPILTLTGDVKFGSAEIHYV